MEFHHRSNQSIKSLVELGAKGLFPLFEKEWIWKARQNSKKLTGNEKVKAKGLLKRISQHQSLDSQKTILISLNEEERNIFIRAFMKMVENKILDLKQELQ